MARGVDEDSGDYLGPSKGDMRREALAVLELAHRLVDQPAAGADRIRQPKQAPSRRHTGSNRNIGGWLSGLLRPACRAAACPTGS